ncbi:hypothetical protein AB751O23_AF_00240 [Chlamydiales bacterium SCGC AB-751-O23]|jgi:hypothetical protein|nr:hypothetical protein AB751O23_AF_00240 [Chlamydiales bacterium SCGC AB-751-O23]
MYRDGDLFLSDLRGGGLKMRVAGVELKLKQVVPVVAVLFFALYLKRAETAFSKAIQEKKEEKKLLAKELKSYQFFVCSKSKKEEKEEKLRGLFQGITEKYTEQGSFLRFLFQGIIEKHEEQRSFFLTFDPQASLEDLTCCSFTCDASFLEEMHRQGQLDKNSDEKLCYDSLKKCTEEGKVFDGVVYTKVSLS